MRSLLVAVVLLAGSCIPIPVRPVPETVFWGWEPDTVVITDRVAAAINSMVALLPATEWAACLRSVQNHEVYIVVEAIMPVQWGNDVDSIRGFDCNGYEGRLHFHPAEALGVPVCERSRTDNASFWGDRMKFEVVWCGKNWFRWYTRNGEQGTYKG
jgi:hypothetical protein